MATAAAAQFGFPNNLRNFLPPNASCASNMMPNNMATMQFPQGAVLPPNSAPLQLMAAMAAAYSNGNGSSASALMTPASVTALMQTQQGCKQQSTGSTTTSTTPSVSGPITATQRLSSTSPSNSGTPSNNSQKRSVTSNNMLPQPSMDELAASVAAQQQFALLASQYGASPFSFGLNNSVVSPNGVINPFMLLSNGGFDPSMLTAAAVSNANNSQNNTK